MIPNSNEIEARASVFAISVNTANELNSHPRKYQAKQQLSRNAIGYAVELREQKPIDCFTHPKRGKKHNRAERKYYEPLHWLKAYRVFFSFRCPHKLDRHGSSNNVAAPENAISSASASLAVNDNLKTGHRLHLFRRDQAAICDTITTIRFPTVSARAHNKEVRKDRFP
jgi:hypothetical protein